MNSDILQRAARRIRSQIARPMDDDWERRYMQTGATGKITGNNLATLIVTAPDAVDRSTVEAAVRDTRVEHVKPRPSSGQQTETVVSLVSDAPF